MFGFSVVLYCNHAPLALPWRPVRPEPADFGLQMSWPCIRFAEEDSSIKSPVGLEW